MSPGLQDLATTTWREKNVSVHRKFGMYNKCFNHFDQSQQTIKIPACWHDGPGTSRTTTMSKPWKAMLYILFCFVHGFRTLIYQHDEPELCQKCDLRWWSKGAIDNNNTGLILQGEREKFTSSQWEVTVSVWVSVLLWKLTVFYHSFTGLACWGVSVTSPGWWN